MGCTKYIYSMLNKFLVLIAVSISIGVNAQLNLPYSSYGVGERANSIHPVFSGMGNQSVTYDHPSVLNTSNPATYSFTRYQFPIFSLGVANRLSYNKVDNVKEFNNATTISEIAFGLSFAKRFGLAFGLRPLYKKSYSFNEKHPLMDGDSVSYDYVGDGILNNAFVGLSVNILNYDSLKWSIGGNVGAVFGNMTDERRSSVIDPLNAAGGAEIKRQQIKSFHYELGTFLQYRLKGDNKIAFGATFEPLQNIKSVYNRQLTYSAVDVSNPNTYQLLSETGEMKGKITFAPKYTVGLAYSKYFTTHKKNGNKGMSQLMTSVGFTLSDWSKYRESYGDTSFTYGFKNSSSFQLGVQYIPETQYVGNVLPKLFERSSYRLGFYYSSLPYVYSGTQLNEWAVTAGFGLPVLVDKRLDSSIQLGIGVGKRGTNQASSFNETFVTVNLGILIAPSINDRWFIKRKLD